MFNVITEAQHVGITMIRPGSKCHEVSDACAEVYKKKGFDKHFSDRMGHSIGVEGHDPPPDFRSFPPDQTLLETGMVFSIEPGCYEWKIGGFRNSDTIQVTTEGNMLLTHLPKDIDSMTVQL